MTGNVYQFGDRVTHEQRPEWGVGSVVKVEEALINGERAQRVSIRFPNAGLKSIIATQAALRRVEANGESHLNGESHQNGSRFEQWERMDQSEWLSPLAQRKIREVMTAIPESCTDAFNSFRKRFTNTVRLYKYDKSGRGLIDWAIAQSGLDDPLSRFTRQELEQLFDRWVTERDRHLGKLLQSAHNEKAVVREVLREAPPAAQQAARRLTTPR